MMKLKPETIAANFVTNLELITREHGSRQAFADAAGITATALNNILRGKVKKGTALVTACVLAHCGGCTLDEIVMTPKKFSKLMRSRGLVVGEKRKGGI